MLAEHTTTPTVDTSRPATGPDPIWVAFKNCRLAAGESLEAVAARLTAAGVEVTAVAIGSYERGDRRPTLAKTRLVCAAAYQLDLGVIPAAHSIVPNGPVGTPTAVEWVVTWPAGTFGDGWTETDARAIARHLPGAHVTRRVLAVTETKMEVAG